MRIGIIILMQLWLITSYGQNFLFQNQSFFKPYLTNPALAGSQGKGNVGIIYKKQLVDFENGPNSQAISIDYPFLRNTTGLGFNILKDQNGPSSFLGFESTFAYHVLTSKKNSKNPVGFSFGLSASMNQFSLDRQLIIGESSDDEIFKDDSKFNDISPNANAGFNFFSHGFNLGVSVYNLMSWKNTIYKDENDLQRAFTVFISAGMEWVVKENWVIHPMMLIRTQENADFQFDIMSEFRYVSPKGSIFSLTPFIRSFNYRTISGNQSLGLNTLISRYPFSLGYQFDFPIIGNNNAYGGDHIFFIGYQLISNSVKKNNRTN
jgi:type IX secretion system PorP/SprF family membrane protein